MTFLSGFLAGLTLFPVIYLLLLKLRPRYVAPTKRRRRDLPEVHNVPSMPVCRTARDANFADVGGIEYQFLGVTGEER